MMILYIFRIKLNETIRENNIILRRIEEKMDIEITPECKKMGSHIDFIESVYEKSEIL